MQLISASLWPVQPLEITRVPSYPKLVSYFLVDRSVKYTLLLVQPVTFSANLANGPQTGQICSRCQLFQVQARTALFSNLRFHFASSTTAIGYQGATIVSFALNSFTALALFTQCLV